MASQEDPVVLSFHDSCIRQSDVDLLNGTHWLNDKLIGFAFEYFEKKQFCEFADEVSYINPDVAQFIKLASAEEVGIFLEPLHLDKKQYVFLSVNDNDDESSAGGSHWSLLIYKMGENQFEHYDSSNGHNGHAARNIAKKVESYLRLSTKATYLERPTPQQANGCDCGVYVISICEHICKRHFFGEETPLSQKISPTHVTQKRSDLKELIISLAR